MDIERHSKAQSICQSLKKKFRFGEIDYFLYLMSNQKPHISIDSNIENQFWYDFPQRFGTYSVIQFKYDYMMLKAFDSQKQKEISLKVFFLESNEEKTYLEKLIFIAEKQKSLPRKDLLLEVFEYYGLKGQNEEYFYFVVELEQVQFAISNYIQNLEDSFSFYQEFQNTMKIAIEYLQEQLLIKYIMWNTDIYNDESMKSQYIQHFYATNIENGEQQIKFDGIIPTITYTNQEKIELIEKIDDLFIINNSFQFGELPRQKVEVKLVPKTPIKITKFKKNSQVINKEQLPKFVQIWNPQLLESHSMELFEILSQYPEYEDYEIIEFEEDKLILVACRSKDKNRVKLRLEKFESQGQAEMVQEKFSSLLKSVRDIFLPIYRMDIIVTKQSAYIIIEEKKISRVLRIQQQGQIAGEEFEQCSLHSLNYGQSDNPFNKKKKRIEFLIHLIQNVERLHQNKLFHGQLSSHDIFLQITREEGQEYEEETKIYLSNPLIDQIRKESTFSKECFIRGKKKDLANLKGIIQEIALEAKRFVGGFGYQEQENSVYFLSFLKLLYNYYGECLTSDNSDLVLESNKQIKKGIKRFKGQVIVDKVVKQYDLKNVLMNSDFALIKFAPFNSFSSHYAEQDDFTNHIHIFQKEIQKVQFLISQKKYFTLQFAPLLSLNENLKCLNININNQFNYSQQPDDDTSFSLTFLKFFPCLKQLLLVLEFTNKFNLDLLQILNLKHLKTLTIDLRQSLDEQCTNEEIVQDYEIYRDLEKIFSEKNNLIKVYLSFNNSRYLNSLRENYLSNLQIKDEIIFPSDTSETLSKPNTSSKNTKNPKRRNSFKFGGKIGEAQKPFQFAKPTTTESKYEFNFGNYNSQEKQQGFNFNNFYSSQTNLNGTQVAAQQFQFGGFGQSQAQSSLNQFPISDNPFQPVVQDGFRSGSTNNSNNNINNNNILNQDVFGNAGGLLPNNQGGLEENNQQNQQEEKKNITFNFKKINNEAKDLIIKFIDSNPQLKEEDVHYIKELDAYCNEFQNIEIQAQTINQGRDLIIEARLKDQPQIENLSFSLSVSDKGEVVKKVDCINLKRFKCNKYGFDLFSQIEKDVKNWIISQFDISSLNIMGLKHKPICNHCDQINLYTGWFSEQKNLKQLTLQFSNVCENVVENLIQDNSFLSFTQPQFKSLHDLTLEFQEIQINSQFFTKLYKNMKPNRTVKCLKIKMSNFDQFILQNMFGQQEQILPQTFFTKDMRSIYKIPRLVKLQFQPLQGNSNFNTYFGGY